MIRRKLILFFLIILPFNIQASDFDKGLESMNNGDYAIAYCLWQPLAQLGHPDAQYNIGWLFANGNGLRVDVKKAVQWWKKAAENGYLDAQFAIGLAYTTGEGIKADTNKAFKWFLKAALSGHEDSKDIVKRLVLDSGKDYYNQFPQIIEISWLKQSIIIKGDVVNLRSGAGTKFPIVYKAQKGEVFTKISQKNGWIEVIIPNQENSNDKTVGWVYAKLAKTL